MIKRTLYFGNPAYLSMKNAQMVLRLPDKELEEERVRTIPIEDIGVVILDHKQITISQGLMERLLENNCAVITCDSTHMPTGLLLPLDGHSRQSERFKAQLACSKPLKKNLWQQTVQAKISNQASALEKCVVGCKTGNMRSWVEAVRSDDAMNLEGRAAVYYWSNFFADIPDFKRNRDGIFPNNLLNYGYAILRGVIARSLVGSGLLPTMGIHHRNNYNAYCLADDVMEPYRPFVDVLVKRVISMCDNPLELSTSVKRELLAIPTLDVRIDGKRRPLMISAEMTTASLARCFTGESRKISYPYF